MLEQQQLHRVVGHWAIHQAMTTDGPTRPATELDQHTQILTAASEPCLSPVGMIPAPEGTGQSRQ